MDEKAKRIGLSMKALEERRPAPRPEPKKAEQKKPEQKKPEPKKLSVADQMAALNAKFKVK